MADLALGIRARRRGRGCRLASVSLSPPSLRGGGVGEGSGGSGGARERGETDGAAEAELACLPSEQRFPLSPRGGAVCPRPPGLLPQIPGPRARQERERDTASRRPTDAANAPSRPPSPSAPRHPKKNKTPTPTTANTVAPSYLTGKLAGDRGFDPLGLGADEGRLKWYAEAEKTNGRWAMAAVAGILFTEATGVGAFLFLSFCFFFSSASLASDRAEQGGRPAGSASALSFSSLAPLRPKSPRRQLTPPPDKNPDDKKHRRKTKTTEPKWFLTGAKDFGVPIAPLVAIQFLITGFFETKRYQGWKESGGSSGFLNSFPFDPAGMSSPANAEKEVKNGRLAMVSFVLSWWWWR